MKLTNFKDFGVDFWINKGGLITCDSYYHDTLIKIFILKNWDSYSQLIDPFQLFKTIGEENLGPLYFDTNGKVVKCHPFISKLIKLDERREFIKSLKLGNDWKIISLLLTGAFVINTINFYQDKSFSTKDSPIKPEDDFMRIFNEITGKYKDQVNNLI